MSKGSLPTGVMKGQFKFRKVTFKVTLQSADESHKHHKAQLKY